MNIDVWDMCLCFPDSMSEIRFLELSVRANNMVGDHGVSTQESSMEIAIKEYQWILILDQMI